MHIFAPFHSSYNWREWNWRPFLVTAIFWLLELGSDLNSICTSLAFSSPNVKSSLGVGGNEDWTQDCLRRMMFTFVWVFLRAWRVVSAPEECEVMSRDQVRGDNVTNCPESDDQWPGTWGAGIQYPSPSSVDDISIPNMKWILNVQSSPSLERVK